MIVAYCFCPQDEELALKNARWMNELGGCQGHTAFMLHDRRCQQPDAVAKELEKSFDLVSVLCAGAEIDGWPQGANYFFRTVAGYLQSKESSFFWLEPDAIPLVEGWLDKLEAEYRRGGRPFMGERVDLGQKRPDVPVHMSGVGIYPNPLHRYAGEAYRAHDVAWDIAAKDQILPKAHLTKQIQHYWKHGTFTHLDEVRPESVIFHSSKDGSLIDLLRKGKQPVPPEETHQPHKSGVLQPVGHTGTPVDGVSSAQPAIRKLRSGIWILEGDSIISEQIVTSGRLDLDTLLPHVLSHIRPGDTVVDVGAFIGDHTVSYSHAVGPEGKVIAYEPSVTPFNCLIHNVEKCGNVFTFNVGLGSQEGVAGMSGEFASAYIDHNNSSRGPVIKVRPLDSDASLFDRFDLMKIDVEGYEVNVLQGAEQLINRFHPKLVIEINEIALKRQNATPQDIMNWVCRHGYSVSILHHHADNAPFYDILCLPVAAASLEVFNQGNGKEGLTRCSLEPPPVKPAPTMKEEVEWHIGVLKTFCESSPKTKAIVMQKLVYAGLRQPNKKKKHSGKDHTTARDRKQAAEQCPT